MGGEYAVAVAWGKACVHVEGVLLRVCRQGPRASVAPGYACVCERPRPAQSLPGWGVARVPRHCLPGLAVSAVQRGLLWRGRRLSPSVLRQTAQPSARLAAGQCSGGGAVGCRLPPRRLHLLDVLQLLASPCPRPYHRPAPGAARCAAAAGATASSSQQQCVVIPLKNGGPCAACPRAIDLLLPQQYLPNAPVESCKRAAAAAAHRPHLHTCIYACPLFAFPL